MAAVSGEYARKLLREKRFRWSQVWSLGTVNPSRKLRRFESFTCHHVLDKLLTSGNVGQGLIYIPDRGIQTAVGESVSKACGPRSLTWANALLLVRGLDVRGEYVRKFGSVPRC